MVNQLLSQIRTLQVKVNALCEENEFYDPETASSSGMSHGPSQPSRIPSPRGMLSRGSVLPHYAANTIRTSGNVLQIYLLKKEYLRPCQEFPWDVENDWNENRRVQRYRPHAISELHFGKFPDPYDFSVLESQLQDQSVRKHLNSWTHHVVDQWSGDVWICRRSCDVAIHQRRVFSWFSDAWCEDCACVEKDHLQYLLQKKCQCSRAASSKVQPILERDANC